MLRQALAAIICGSCVASTCVWAQVDPPCHTDAAVLVAQFEKQGLRVFADAITERGSLLQFLHNPDTDDFVIVERLASGPGCVFLAGFGMAWIDREVPAP